MSEHRTTYACTCGHRHHIASKQAEHRRVADVEARADLAAAIISAVEAMPFWQANVHKDAVLDAIREASDDRRA